MRRVSLLVCLAAWGAAQATPRKRRRRRDARSSAWRQTRPDASCLSVTSKMCPTLSHTEAPHFAPDGVSNPREARETLRAAPPADRNLDVRTSMRESAPQDAQLEYMA